MNNPETADIHASVVVYGHEGELLTTGASGEPISWERREVKKSDKYKKIYGDGNARVNVGLSETLGGPYGFSSVQVRVSVSVSCNQDVETVREAEGMLLADCMAFVDDTMTTAHDMLCTHLDQIYDKAQQ